MDDLIPLTGGRPKPNESSMVVRCLRPVRNALQNNGLIGRVTESAIYSVSRILRLIWLFVMVPALWSLEQIGGRYMLVYLMTPEDRINYEFKRIFDKFIAQQEKEEELLGPLGKVLESDAAVYFNDILFYWLLFDLFLWLVYKVVKCFTLESNEDVQQVVVGDEKKLLGHEATKCNDNLLNRLVRTRVFRYWAIYCLVMELVGRYIDAFVDLDALDDAREIAVTQNIAQSMTKVDFSTVNPFRYPFPPDQDWILREVLYMKHVLVDLSPTSLPGDDYELISNILQNLSTRKDLSWRVYEETEISQPVTRAAERRAGYHIADEPFSIADRVEALSKHWTGLVLGAESPPERWEETSTTTFVKPLLHGHSISGDPKRAVTDPGHALILTPSQSALADNLYAKWRKNYNRQYSYFKDHPPDPIGWVAIPKSDAATRNDWNKVCNAWGLAQGQPVRKPPAKQAYKPVYSRMHFVPFGHQAPSGLEGEVMKEIEVLDVEYESSEVRRKRQDEYLKELKLKKEAEELKINKEL